MAFTATSDLFGSVHEDALNLVIRHVMRQRPSLFNYGTPVFRQRPRLFCKHPIEVADSVVEAGDPVFTEMDPLPVLGAPVPLGVNFCIQITEAEIDLHPGNVIGLPPELDPLPAQSFAVHLRACAGIDCPGKNVIEELTPLVEAALLEQQALALGELEEEKRKNKGKPPREKPPRDSSIPPVVPPGKRLVCFCLDVFGVGNFEWGPVIGSQQSWLKTRLDGLEIVDIEPKPMEAALECYVSTILRLGILPRLIVPTEKLVLDITQEVKKQGLTLNKQVKLQPAAVPAQVPNNPAVEDDQLKAFIDLEITP